MQSSSGEITGTGLGLPIVKRMVDNAGGTVSVTGGSSFDCDGTAQYNGGTIIVNGQQVDSIPNQMMGGMRGGFGGGSRGGGGWH